MSHQKPSVLILAAGFSSRMGMPKYALKLNNGKTFLEVLISQYLDFDCEEIAVVLNRKGMETVGQSKCVQQPRVKLVENPSPKAGRFLSIKLGLKVLGFEGPVFMQNIDNPFAPGEILEMLKNNLTGFDFVKPVYKGKGGHPVLLGSSVIRHVLEHPSADMNFKSLLSEFLGNALTVEDERVLVNVNTVEDYKKFNL